LRDNKILFHRKRHNQAFEENELLRRNIIQREETLSQCEHDMDKAKKVIDNTIQALSDVLQVWFLNFLDFYDDFSIVEFTGC
jgi:hypothetical protein